jgi:hypothetical protein
MTLVKTIFASAAALGLAAAPMAAQAGPVRSATLVTKSEKLTDSNTPAYIAAAAFAIAIAVILATSDNGHGVPVSPG